MKNAVFFFPVSRDGGSFPEFSLRNPGLSYTLGGPRMWNPDQEEDISHSDNTHGLNACPPFSRHSLFQSSGGPTK